MTSRANVPSFSAEDNANARVWFDNLLKYKDSMKWSDEQTNRVGQLALVGKASKWVEYLTLNDSGSLATLDEFKKAFLERFDKSQSVLESSFTNLRLERTCVIVRPLEIINKLLTLHFCIFAFLHFCRVEGLLGG